MSKSTTPPTHTPNPLTGLALGRIVHYVLDGTSERPETRGRVRAAIVSGVLQDVDVNLGLVSLTVFTGGDIDGLTITHLVQGRPFNAAHEPGTWHWPERSLASHEASAGAQPVAQAL